MCMKNLGSGSLAALLLLLSLVGCGKSAPGDTKAGSQSSAALGAPISTLHWLGMKRLAADTNAAAFMNIWNLPESANLRVQTLDRLALAPWRMLPLSPTPTNLNPNLNPNLNLNLNPYPVASNYLATAIFVPAERRTPFRPDAGPSNRAGSETGTPLPAQLPATNGPLPTVPRASLSTNSPRPIPMSAKSGPAPTNPPPVALYQSLVTNAPASLLRPLLDDLLQEECYLEVCQPTNQPGQLAFAIKLDDARAALWQTNLAAVLASLTGANPTPTTNGWSAEVQSPEAGVQSPKSKVQSPDADPATRNTQHAIRNTDDAPRTRHHVCLTRAGQWTILGLTQTAADQPSPAAPRPSPPAPQLLNPLRFPHPVSARWNALPAARHQLLSQSRRPDPEHLGCAHAPVNSLARSRLGFAPHLDCIRGADIPVRPNHSPARSGQECPRPWEPSRDYEPGRRRLAPRQPAQNLPHHSRRWRECPYPRRPRFPLAAAARTRAVEHPHQPASRTPHRFHGRARFPSLAEILQTLERPPARRSAQPGLLLGTGRSARHALPGDTLLGCQQPGRASCPPSP